MAFIGQASLAKPSKGYQPIPKNVSKAMAKKLKTVEQSLTSFDCPFLVQLFHPKDLQATQLGFCMYSHTETRGIFAKTACVGVLIEPDTQTRNAFYGKRGHWGIENKCEAKPIKKKFQDPEIDQTVNPITSIRIKRKEGTRLRLLRDDFGIWDLFKKRTTP